MEKCPIETTNLSELQVAWSAAIEARQILTSHFGDLHEVEEKFQAGLVSEADKNAEKAIVERITKAFPDHLILGEESGLNKDQGLDTEYKGPMWIIDPLDGTTNYVHQFPIFCISIGFMNHGKMQVGVVDAPMIGQRFVAAREHGAFLSQWFGAKLKQTRLSVSSRKKVDDFLIGTGFSVSRKDMLEEQLEVFSQIIHKTRGIRRAGAAAYDLCMVAQGSFDGFWESGLAPWDTAAGCLLIEEAGGLVTNFKGEDFSPFMSSIIGGTSTAHKELKDSIEALSPKTMQSV